MSIEIRGVELKPGMKVRLCSEEECREKGFEVVSPYDGIILYKGPPDACLYMARHETGKTLEIEHIGLGVALADGWVLEPWMIAEIVHDPAQPKGWLAGTSKSGSQEVVNGPGALPAPVKDVEAALRKLHKRVNQCECGKEKHGFMAHSTWCPLYGGK